MKKNITEFKKVFSEFNIYQKTAAVVLALSVVLCVSLGVNAMTKFARTSGESESVESSHPSSISTPSSSSEESTTSVIKDAIKVSLKPSSVEEDLEVKVVNEKGEMIVGPVFRLTVKGVKNGYSKTWEVNDGFLKLTKLPSGDYTVSIEPVDGYIVPSEPTKCKVEKKVEYKKIDVSDKLVDDSKVDSS